jgi:RNA polymerase sigma factor (sigma-70 family)
VPSSDSTDVNTPFNDPRADELLVIRCQLGERAAFDALILRWHEPTWRYLRRLADGVETTADLAQDMWLRVFRGIARLREPQKFRPWLFGIARRAAMDRLRGKYSRVTESSAELENLPADDPAHDDDVEQALTALEQQVASLALPEREAVTLFYLRELTIEEIAAVTSVPVGTVKSRLFRARQSLRRALASRGETR